MGEARITSLDVARLAGVSQSAVSRVFTGASASAETVEKVRAAAEELGYRPNIARARHDHRAQPDDRPRRRLSRQPVLSRCAIERLSAALQQRGYHVLLHGRQLAGEYRHRGAGPRPIRWTASSTASVALSRT
jgi:DNA-binding LacI/PurR family transcriptional regulator